MAPISLIVLVAVGVGLGALASLGLGAVSIEPSALVSIGIQTLGGEGGDHSALQEAVLTQIRTPRLVFGLLCGAALGLCGAVLQGLFRNPLADPGLLGVTAGAALAVGLAVVAFPQWRGAWGPWALPSAAFVGGLVSVGLVWLLSRASSTGTTGLVLAGVAVTSLAGAGTGLVISVAQDAELRDITFWSLGSLGGVTWPTLGAALPWILLPLPVLPWLARHLDALLLGDREARSLGTPVALVEGTALFLTAGAVGAATALAGGVGFVGLVAPHLARGLVGPIHRYQLPLAAILGAGLTVGADTLARLVVAPAELPLGVILALLGAPFLLRLLLAKGGQ